MKQRNLILPLTSAILVLAMVVPATASTFVQAELQPGDLTLGSLFGRSVAAAGQTLVAGAFTLTAPGAAYVYQRSSDAWSLQTELHAPQPAAQDDFGLSVATDGATVVVGAVGATYIFVNNNGVWTAQAQIALTGFSVAVSHDTMAVAGSGQVFVYRRNSSGIWNAEASWAIPQATAVALDSNTLVVGAAVVGTSLGTEVGTAFVFVRNNNVWTQQATLNANDPASFAQFGFAVSVSGDTAVIGAPGDGSDVLNPRPGSAYVYVRNNGIWTEQAELFGLGASVGSNFGTGLAVIGNTIVVGAYDDDDSIGGSAFLYNRNGVTWTQTAELLPDNAQSGQRFANTVAMADTNTFVFGSPNVSSPLRNSGAVYVFMQH